MRASTVLVSLPIGLVLLAPLHAQEVRSGAAAFGNWEGDAPGVGRYIRPTDLPRPTVGTIRIAPLFREVAPGDSVQCSAQRSDGLHAPSNLESMP